MRAPMPLELIVSPLGVFDSFRLMSQGTVLTRMRSALAKLHRRLAERDEVNER